METEEHKKERYLRIARARMKNNPNWHTEETKKRIGLANKGKKRKPFTEEHKQKLRDAKALYHPLKGKHHTEETIIKLKASRQKRINKID